MSKVLAIFITVLLVVLDQASKMAAVRYLYHLPTLPLIPGVLHLTYAENSGAAFGLFQGGRWFFVAFTMVVIGVIAHYFVKMPNSREYGWVRVALVLIAGGALGNFTDRLLKGFVVDFIHIVFIRFPIFNLADIFIVVGTILISFLMLFVIKDDA